MQPNLTPITLKKVANDIMPGWDTLDHWLAWPPDFFALCSIVLQKTGGYRLSLLHPEYWEQNGWGDFVWRAARSWKNYTNDLLLGAGTTADHFFSKDKYLSSIYPAIQQGWDTIEIDRLRVISDLYIWHQQTEKPLIDLGTAMLQLMAVADEACGR